MPETVNYKHIEREKLDSVFGKAKSQNAFCVVTAEDDMALVRERTFGDRQVLLVPRVNVVSAERVEDDVINDDWWGQLLNMNQTAFRSAVTVEFLGAYRFVPPTGRGLVLPFAVDLNLPSDEIEISTTTDSKWVDFDWVEQFIADNEPPNVGYATDSHQALSIYLQSMTYVE